MKPLYVFDFDGVLFDTARECLAVAYAASRKRPGPAAERWRDVASPTPELATAFLAHRHWVGPPWQYAVLLDLLATEQLPSTTEQFLAIANARKAELASFTDLYFATRGELSEDVATWCSVIEPFADAVQAFRKLGGDAVILSTRDDRSIQRILGHFAGITPTLLPRSGTKEKWQILVEAAEARGLPASAVFFLDDYAHHALPALKRGISAHLALWGYLGADDVHNAKAGGLPCLQLTDLERALARHAEEIAS
ncbi:MAG TPA: HAD family hydrolase [Kofleriaceae bacterium]|nr:HAD family hydrolase [Kofleriaceae bacterium]